MSNLVAIVGRPNVGKSTLFNRLVEERKAIVDNISGVTRDRIYGESTWNGRDFSVVDTGGYVKGSDDVFEAAIRTQVKIAIEEANVIVFLTDVTTGITDLDESIAQMLRKISDKVILVVNKVDNHTRELSANEFWALGFETTIFVSSITGGGTGDLLDTVVEMLPEMPKPTEVDANTIPKIAIVGQPNVGKSSLVNILMDEERNIVTDIAGTTRDSIKAHYNKFGKEFVLIDTAGMRKKAKVTEDLEFYSVIRAIKAIDESDVCILMLDASLGIEGQDLHIFGSIIKKRKGIVVLVNKWDLVEKVTNTAKEFEAALKKKMAPFNDVPIIFISVHERQRILQSIDTAIEVFHNRNQKIKTSVLNEVMLAEIEKIPPPMHRGRQIKIKYITQLPTYFPAFAFFCNHPTHVKSSYKGFLENKLREHFNFKGVPIGIYFRDK